MPKRAAICWSRPYKPRYGRTTLPFLMRSCKIGRAALIGMAKPRPSTPSLEILALLMPMTLPSASTRAPPELPGLMAASVWMSFMLWPSAPMVRLRELMTPTVTVPWNSRPRGLPIAMAGSPTWRESLSPNSATGRLSILILTTARSVFSSRPTTVPSVLWPSAKETMTVLAVPTTWLLVTI